MDDKLMLIKRASISLTSFIERASRSDASKEEVQQLPLAAIALVELLKMQ